MRKRSEDTEKIILIYGGTMSAPLVVVEVAPAAIYYGGSTLTAGGRILQSSLFGQGVVKVGEVYFLQGTFRTAMDLTMQYSLSGDASKVDAFDSFLNGFTLPGASAVFGGGIDYFPMHKDKSKSLRIVGINKSINEASFDFSMKYTFGGNGLGGYTNGATSLLKSPSATQVGWAANSYLGKLVTNQTKQQFNINRK